MILLALLLAGPPSSTLPDPVNPGPNQCVTALVEEERTDPTYIDPDGELVSVRFMLVCGMAVGADDLRVLTLTEESVENPGNPTPQECVVDLTDNEGTAPTYLDPDGETIGSRMALMCGIQSEPDDYRLWTLDQETAEVVIAAVEEWTTDD
jgi:hypothetical protein